MKKSCVLFVFLLVLTIAACNQKVPLSEITHTQKPEIFGTSTLDSVEAANITSTPIIIPSSTPFPTNTSTTFPTFDKPPTPAPPSEVWLVYTYADTGISFFYPANWFVYSGLDEAKIYIANFRLDGMQLKGFDDEKIKIDISKIPMDISNYSSLKAYLDALEQKRSKDEPGELLLQIDLPHQDAGYDVIRQTHSGFMGQVDATYDKVYVARGGMAIQILVYGKQYADVVERIANTLVFP
ncbi:MAG: hypothetical protein ABIG63_06155 [Chloroflexota bacterium]